MKNVEFKAELRDRALAETVLRAMRATHIGTLEQTDTYFRVTSGRLKKRECVGEPTEWIRYERPDAAEPRVSDFTIYSENEALARFGTNPIPVRTVVKKTRDLYMLGPVRIHLDDVADLGSFIEFEALLGRGCNEHRGRELVAELRAKLGHAIGEPLSSGYADLLDPEG